MLDESKTVLIVGTGHAGGAAGAALRQYGFKGRIIMIGEEPLLPYQRPPLSKTYLKSDLAPDALKQRPANFYADSGIAVRLGERVDAVDPQKRTVRLSDGGSLGYDVLILATGSLVRTIDVPGADLQGLHVLRSQKDADLLKAALRTSTRLAIVGAGYVGLEVAASAREVGVDVVVIERESRVLARVASSTLAEFVSAHHRARGVSILTDAAVSAFVGDEQGRVKAVRLADGREVACDAAVIGVGALPCDILARSAGLACDNGVIVDEEARTSDPFIHAIGDMTSRTLSFYEGRRFRLESVPNALEQAKQVAACVTGQPAPAPEMPWFWSDQYDLKLQMAGLGHQVDRTIVRGSPETNKFTLFHMSSGRVVIVESVNLPVEFITAKTFLTSSRPVDAAALADIEVPIKSERIFRSEAPGNKLEGDSPFRRFLVTGPV